MCLVFFNAFALDVVVVGNKSIETETIKVHAGLDGVLKITDDIASDTLKKIYATGFFTDVQIKYDDESIKITVKETPVIKKIEFNGSKAIGKDKIAKELTSKEKKFFSKTDILNDTKRLEMIYQKLGYLNAKIEPLVEFSDDYSQVVVIFNITEGKKSQIRNVKIYGNKEFSDSVIKDEALTIRQRSIFKFNFGANFDIEQIQNEEKNIEKFYMTRGFPKIKIKNIVSIFNYKKNLFDVGFYIEEGLKYKFGTYNVNNIIEDFDEKTIKKKMVLIEKNKIFNIEKIEKSVSNIQDLLYEKGFMFAQVEYSLDFTEDNKVNVIFTLKNSKRVYLHRIDIVGNTKTSDRIIRREFLLKEGDVYNITKLRRSIQRLHNLQYFEDVQIDEKLLEGTTDRMVATITVKERSTASVNASIGFDQINGISGNIGVSESNFLGEGYSASTSFEKTAVSEGYSLSFVEPYFHDKNILIGSNFSYSRYGNPKFVAYDSRTSSIGLTIAYSITEYLRHSINYRYQLDDISQNSSNVSLFILAQLGKYTTSALAHTLSYDKRDNNFIPNEGYSIIAKQELAGLGGNVKFISNELRADWYQTMFNIDGLVLGLKGRVAQIQGMGGNVNLQNLYSLGGGFGLRGFNYRGVGPRLAYLNGNGSIGSYESFSYGGKSLQLASVELRFPNALPKDIGLITYLFTDIGTLYGIDNQVNTSNTIMLDEKKYRASAGLGVSWRSPMGPIGFAFGKPLQSTVYDNKLFFLITFGGMGQF